MDTNLTAEFAVVVRSTGCTDVKLFGGHCFAPCGVRRTLLGYRDRPTIYTWIVKISLIVHEKIVIIPYIILTGKLFKNLQSVHVFTIAQPLAPVLRIFHEMHAADTE